MGTMLRTWPRKQGSASCLRWETVTEAHDSTEVRTEWQCRWTHSTWTRASPGLLASSLCTPILSDSMRQCASLKSVIYFFKKRFNQKPKQRVHKQSPMLKNEIIITNILSSILTKLPTLRKNCNEKKLLLVSAATTVPHPVPSWEPNINLTR